MSFSEKFPKRAQRLHQSQPEPVRSFSSLPGASAPAVPLVQAATLPEPPRTFVDARGNALYNIQVNPDPYDIPSVVETANRVEALVASQESYREETILKQLMAEKMEWVENNTGKTAVVHYKGLPFQVLPGRRQIPRSLAENFRIHAARQDRHDRLEQVGTQEGPHTLDLMFFNQQVDSIASEEIRPQDFERKELF